jgi:phage-related protein
MNGTVQTMVGTFAGGALLGAVNAAKDAIVGLGASTVSVASDFESGMARFASVAGSSLAQAGFSLDDVKAKALELGAVTQFSAAEAQDAMINLAKGGVPVQDIMAGATQATLDLAAAGELGLANAADIVAKQLGVWASTGVQAADVSNLMAQAANASTVDVGELAMGLAQVGGVGKVAGLSFQDLTQTMALIAPGFGSASDAGTSLKGVLLGMTPSTNAAKEQFRDLGLMAFDAAEAAKAFGVDISNSGDPLEEVDAAMRQYIQSTLHIKQGTTEFNKAYDDLYSKFEYSKFYDASGSFLGMQNAAGLLQGSLAGMGEDAKAAALKVMFGTDSFRAAAFLAEQGASGFDAMGVAMNGAGSAAEQAAIRNQTFTFAWDSLKGSIETVQILIGSALLPALTGLVNEALIPAVNAVMEVASALIASNDPWATFLDLINQLVPGLGTVVGFITANFLPIASAIGAMILAVVVPAFWTWAIAAGAAAIATITAALPVIAIIAAIGLASGLLVAAWTNNWFGIQEATASVWATIEPYFTALIAWLSVAIPAGIAAAATGWQTLVAAVSGFVTSVVAGWGVVVAAVTGFVTNVQAGAALVVSVLGSAWTTLTTTTSAAWAAVVAVVQGVVGVITTIITAAWNTIVFLTSSAWGAIWQSIGPPLTAAAGFVATGVAQIVGALSGAWAAAVSVTSSTWAAVSGVLSSAWAAISGVVSSGVAVVVGMAAAGWAELSAAASSAWATLTGLASAFWAGLQALFQTGVALVVTFLTGGWAAAQSSTSAAWANVQGIMSGVWSVIQTIIQTAVAVATTSVTGAWAAIVAASNNDFTQVGAIISSTLDSIKSTISGAVETIKTTFSQMSADAVALGRNIIDGLIKGVAGGVGALTNAVKNAAKSALDTAKSFLGIHSPSAVMASQVGVPIVDGIVQGLKSASPKATAAMLDLGSKLLDVVTKGVEAFGKLTQLGSVPQSAITRFAEQMLAALTAFSTMAMQWDKAAMSAASQFTAKAGGVVELMAKGVDFLTKLAQLGPIAPRSFEAFQAGLAAAIRIVLDLAQRQTLIALSGAVGFAEAAGKIVGVIGAGVDAFKKLEGFTLPALAQFDAFSLAMGRAVGYVIRVANWFVGQPMTAAAAFADTTGKIVAVIGTGVDAFKKLETFTLPALALFDAFSLAMGRAVGYVIRVANWFAGQPMASAVQFADTAGKIISVIGSGVDSLAKLKDFQPVTAESVATFTNAMALFVGMFINSVRGFNLDVTAEAGKFAESAGKIVGIVGSGVDGLTKLADFREVTGASVDLFNESLTMFVARFAANAALFDAEATAAAGAFAESAGKIVGILSNGVQGLSALADLGPVEAEQIDKFVAAVRVVVTAIAAAAVGFTAEGLAAATAFADAAGKSVGILKAGVEGFYNVDTFAGVSVEGIDRFGVGVRLAVAKMLALATEFGAEGTASAEAFAKAAGESTDFLKKGVEGFKKLAEFEGVPAAGLAAFGEGVRQVVVMIVQLSGTISSQMIGDANRFAVGVDQVIELIKGGMKGFSDLAGAANGVQPFMVDFMNSVQHLVVDFQQAVVPASENIGYQIAAGMARGIGQGTPAIQSSIYAAVNAAILAARQALGIASPSKVFDAIGQFAGAGLAQGFGAAEPTVAAAAGQMAASSVAPAARGAGLTSAPARLGGGGGGSVSNTTTVEKGAITVVQQPGESADAVANRVFKLLEQKYGLRGT